MAVKWLREAAEAGHLDAQTTLGSLYGRGSHGIERDHAKALKWLQKAVEQGYAPARNDLAWLLATCPDANIRDGARAVVLAEQAVDESPDAAKLDTLAAAYAEVGRFEDAIATQRRVISMFDHSDPAVGEAMTSHMNAYLAGRPWRERDFAEQ
jgi:TPR repeat protein